VLVADDHLAILEPDIGLDEVHRPDEGAKQPPTAVAKAVGYPHWSIACECHALVDGPAPVAAQEVEDDSVGLLGALHQIAVAGL